MSAPHRPASRSAGDLALRVTLLVLLLDPSLFWFQRLPVVGLAGAGLVFAHLLRAPGLWAAMFVAVAWPVVWNWPFSDNHDYLRVLWVGAVALSLRGSDPRAALAANARLLLGGTFLFATLWKLVLSPDFVDGSFFRVTLLTDGRFHELAVLFGGMTDASLEALDLAMDAAFRGDPVTLPPLPPALGRLATFLTVYTGAIEAAIALCFLWPRPERGPGRIRNLVLLGFAATTFAFATVRGFGWLLMTLGLAQCRQDETRTRVAYVAMIFVIEAYRSVPFGRWLVEAFGPG